MYFARFLYCNNYLYASHIMQYEKKTYTQENVMPKEYAINLPYPKLTGTLYPQDVRCIVDDYSGRAGELTAITQYIYQQYISHSFDEELAKELLRIAIVEMHHHELLGEAIAQMGGDPIMGGSTCFWSGSNVNYTKNPVTFLRNNIQAEYQAIANYRRSIACVRNESLKELLARIIMDEELHIEIFTQQLKRLTGEDSEGSQS